MSQRSMVALACLLSLTAVAADKPLDLRLPAAEVDGTRYQPAELAAALYVFSARPPKPGAASAEPAQPIVLLWDDGRVLWSNDLVHGGPPYRTGKVTPERATVVAKRIAGYGPELLVKESLGPDSSFATLVVRLPGGRYAQMKSWHPREPGAKTVATSHGLEPLEGRDPAAVLAGDTKEYQAFRRVWRQVEDELLSVSRVAKGAQPVTPKLEWAGLHALPPASGFTLRLERNWDEGTWHFVIDGQGEFKSVAALRAFLETQPRGTTLTWDPGCKRLGDEPLLSNGKDLAAFKAFCADHGILLDIKPGG